MSNQVKPNFFIVGAARSGTSSLYEYMRQHPDIFLCNPKEPMYFAFPEQRVNFSGPGDDLEINAKAVTSLQMYLALFQGAKQKALGEASANYLYSATAPKTIAKFSPNAKLIAVLRNPVDRAYSSYLYTLRDGRETATSFEQALELEQKRIADNWEHLWHYSEMGFYFEQIKRYLEYFPEQQIKIILQEDLKKDTGRVLREVFEFLDVDPNFEPEIGLEYNQGGQPKFALLNSILTRPSKFKQWIRPFLPRFLLNAVIALKHKNLSKPDMEDETRKMLVDLYRKDIESLEKLIGRDLDGWMS